MIVQLIKRWLYELLGKTIKLKNSEKEIQKNDMYSQNNEEQIIIDYFNGFIGTFISVGENDGITLSNVRRLAELGWTGVMVEPSPEAYRRLCKNYERMKGFYFYPFALGEMNGTTILHESGEHLGKGDVALLSTIDESEKSRWIGTPFYKVEVKVFRWKTFLNRLKIKKFDFISLDAESMDYQILIQIDLTDTKLLCIEYNTKEDVKQKILEYTSKFGMNKVIYQCAENLIISR